MDSRWFFSLLFLLVLSAPSVHSREGGLFSKFHFRTDSDTDDESKASVADQPTFFPNTENQHGLLGHQAIGSDVGFNGLQKETTAAPSAERPLRLRSPPPAVPSGERPWRFRSPPSPAVEQFEFESEADFDNEYFKGPPSSRYKPYTTPVHGDSFAEGNYEEGDVKASYLTATDTPANYRRNSGRPQGMSDTRHPGNSVYYHSNFGFRDMQNDFPDSSFQDP